MPSSVGSWAPACRNTTGPWTVATARFCPSTDVGISSGSREETFEEFVRVRDWPAAVRHNL